MYSMFVIYNSFSDLEKTELFMELYGNVLMNSHALEYLKNKSNDLIRYKLYLQCNLLVNYSHSYCI